MRLLVPILFLSLLAACKADTEVPYDKRSGACEYDELLQGFSVTLTPISPDWTPLDLAFANARHGVVVGTEGHVLLTQDSGRTWRSVDNLPGEWLNRRLEMVDFVDEELLIIGNSRQQNLLRSRDGGTSFEELLVGPSGDDDITDVAFFDARRGIVRLGYAQLLHTTDGGDTWETIDLPETVKRLSDRIFSGFGQAYLVAFDESGGQSLLRYTPGGMIHLTALPLEDRPDSRAGFIQVIDEHYVAVYLRDILQGFLYTPKDRLFVSGDQGMNWRERMVISPNRVGAIYFENAQLGYVFIRDRVYDSNSNSVDAWVTHQTNDSGVTWEDRIHPPSCGVGGRMVGVQPGRFVMANSGEILRFDRD